MKEEEAGKEGGKESQGFYHIPSSFSLDICGSSLPGLAAH